MFQESCLKANGHVDPVGTYLVSSMIHISAKGIPSEDRLNVTTYLTFEISSFCFITNYIKSRIISLPYSIHVLQEH